MMKTINEYFSQSEKSSLINEYLSKDKISLINEYLLSKSKQKTSKKDDEALTYVLYRFTSDTLQSDKILREKVKNLQNRTISLYSKSWGTKNYYMIFSIKELKDCYSSYIKIYKNNRKITVFKIDELYGADEKDIKKFIKTNNDSYDDDFLSKENKMSINLNEQ